MTVGACCVTLYNRRESRDRAVPYKTDENVLFIVIWKSDVQGLGGIHVYDGTVSYGMISIQFKIMSYKQSLFLNYPTKTLYAFIICPIQNP